MMAAEPSVVRFQSQEYARASMMYSDLDFAYQLQMNEVLAASALSSGVKLDTDDGRGSVAVPVVCGRARDRAVALLVQSGELKKCEQELKDNLKAKRESEGLAVEIQRRLHDSDFAKSIDEMPEEEWQSVGDEFEKPFDEDDWKENQTCTLFFAKAREDPGSVGVAWALTDAVGHVLFQQSEFLGRGMNACEAGYNALISGLAYARSAGVQRIVAKGDSPAVSSQVSGRWRARTPTQLKLLEKVREYEQQFDSLTIGIVPKEKNQYVTKLAHQAIESHMSELLKNGEEVGETSESSKQGKSEDCPICFERSRIAEMFVVKSCSHRFCRTCLCHHVETQVKANQVPVRCPQDCTHHVGLEECQSFLPPKLLESFGKSLTEATIPESDRVYCPFPNCSALMSKGGLNLSVMGSSSSHPHATSVGCTECMECHRLFCVECQVPWHSELSCAQYQKLPVDGRDAEDFKLYKLASHKNWQRCKECRRMIELDQGCYHMTCRCGHEFCYTCGAEWKNKQATCKCKLWDENNIINEDVSSESEDESDYDYDSEDLNETKPVNMYYKTKICRHWERGYCWIGDGCNFAHGEGDLRRVEHVF